MDKSLKERLQRIEDQLEEHEGFHNSTLDIIAKIGPCFEKLNSVVDECSEAIVDLERRTDELEKYLKLDEPTS